MEEQKTRQKICSAAVSLFTTKGFSGTSVREIAKKAKVNPALISYYFDGKQGLLESLMGSFFEGYLEKLETAYKLSDSLPLRHCLHKAIWDLLVYQQENNHLARFVYRETTLDTTLTREIMTIYLRKEKFYWQKLFDKGFKMGEFKKQAVDLTIVQLKGMIMMPFMNPQYLQEIFNMSPSEHYFAKRYGMRVLDWIDERFCRKEVLQAQQTAEVIHFRATP
ncbi:TetR family transcriptional regulator [Pueribacillus theae]|uniref:TetR family transcriptional regulator n=1 Tax=Pueribacillus theae TaxID=2171751 RepID=A0A2U1K0Z9_9BACI|nr:forespore capture DNA-binding protein RefZ [Pueribacillus theae]PWA11151.1 TetR family transcriptional regulator [Pueribacillus theae]